MNKTGPNEVVELTDWGPESAVESLSLLYDIMSLWTVRHNRLLFPAYAEKRLFVDRVKRLSELAGLDGDYAGHSFRSGGACNLYASNVPIEASYYENGSMEKPSCLVVSEVREDHCT